MREGRVPNRNTTLVPIAVGENGGIVTEHRAPIRLNPSLDNAATGRKIKVGHLTQIAW
jgi:hypothetical protein